MKTQKIQHSIHLAISGLLIVGVGFLSDCQPILSDSPSLTEGSFLSKNPNLEKKFDNTALPDGWEYYIPSINDSSINEENQTTPVEGKFPEINPIHLEFSPDKINREDFAPVSESDLVQLHELHPDKQGFIWLRKKFDHEIESSLSNGDSNQELLTLIPGRIAWADRTYLNGNLIGETGSFPPHQWSAWNTIREYNFPSSYLKSEGNEILILLYVEHEGFIYDMAKIGTHTGIKDHYFIQKFITSYINAFVAFLFFIISIYHGLIYFKRKKDKENYYYAIFACLYALYSTNFFSEYIHAYIPVTYLTYQKFIILVQTGMVYYLIRFFSTFFKIDFTATWRYPFVGIISIPAIVMLFFPDYGSLHRYRAWIVMAQYIPAFGFLVYSVFRGMKSGLPQAKAMIYGMVPLFIVIFHDFSLVIFNIQDSVFLAGLGLPLFLSSIMFILAGKFVSVQNQTDELNATLESRVEERTAEVTKRMEEIQSLKVQQDGDYFLTSLINKPLSTNFNKSKTVSTSAIIHQKKQFQFRNKKSELGGDICITGNLRFGDGKDRWVVFFNADAMGKSMQGAGGSIVAGTAMNNIMSRSAQNNRILDITPQDWVSNTYQELNSIFLTFNGSMLISCVLGLLNERTGEMCYFNAEHPWTAIYRDGKAFFMEEELVLRKLGSDSEFQFRVKRYEIQSGDVLFVGSDGRDDINLGPPGSRQLNEDEFLFLRLIEEARGDLDTLYQLIDFQGELTDDLSLIRIGFQEEYNPNAMEEEVESIDLKQAKEAIRSGNRIQAKFILDKILEENKQDIAALKVLIKILFEDKKYSDTIERINEFHKIRPDTELFWFEKSVCYKQIQDYVSAKASGMACRKFQPNRVANLINLADSYRMLGEEDEARRVLREAMRLEPENESGIKLGRILSVGGLGI